MIGCHTLHGVLIMGFPDADVIIKASQSAGKYGSASFTDEGGGIFFMLF